MPRSELSAPEIEAFRQRLCEVAGELFAQHGHEGVTLRVIARELGCSPMTPYRYFRDKAEIFAAVRAAAFRRLAEVQETAFESTDEPEVRLGALADAFVATARREPHTYRLMFGMTLPGGVAPRELAAGEVSGELARDRERAFEPMRRAVVLAIEDGRLAGDPDAVARLFWAGFHGLISLELAGGLPEGGHDAETSDPIRLDALVSPMEDALIEGNRPRNRRRRSRGFT